MKLDFFGVHARTIGLYALLVLWCAIAFSLALAEIATVVALLFWVLWRFREGIRAPRIDRAAVWLLAGYVLLCLLSLFWTEAPKESYRGIFKVLKYAAIFWMSAEIFRENSARKKFQTVFLVFYGILILDGFIQYYAGRDVLRGVILQEASSGGRVSASFKSFGLLASYLVCTIPFLIALGWAYYCSGRKRWYAWTIGFMAAAACLLLFWTRSRGAWLALIAGGILWLFWSRKWKWLLGLGILLAGLYFVLPRSMIIHQNAEGQEQSIVERYYLWDRALNVIKAKPWTGTGINSYVKAHIR
ncbi:MAG: O-antigen ligase family protein, partial [Candidatus Omnitrophota bacterium]